MSNGRAPLPPRPRSAIRSLRLVNEGTNQPSGSGKGTVSQQQSMHCDWVNRSLLMGQRIGGALSCSLLLMVTNCSQQQGGTPINTPMRAYVREVYHTSPYTIRSVFNLAVTNQVWNANPVLSYDSLFHGQEYRGELASCRIEPFLLTSQSLSPPTYSLYQDSGFFYDQQLQGGGVAPHGDAIALFNTVRTVGDSAIPVFVFPRLVLVTTGGMNLFHGFYGEAHSHFGGAITPSVWLNSRGLTTSPQPPFPGSTLAHELGHIALTSIDNVIWGDDSTPFLHILTHTGVSRLARQSAVPGPAVQTTATDSNRRFLIRFGISDACILARTNFDFSRPVLP